MPKLAWDSVGEKTFEAGVDRGVLYVKDGVTLGVPWNGLTSVSENPSGGEAQPTYLDGVKIVNEAQPEEFEATINAFTFPNEFAVCDGTAAETGIIYGQQVRQEFDLCYRTLVGNDVQNVDHAYKIHLIYNALAAPSQVNRQTMGQNTDPANFSWKITTRPIMIPGYLPTAHLIIDSRKIKPSSLKTIEDYLYGTDLVDPRMLYPEQIKEILPWLFFEIIPNPETGLSALVLSENILDVRGDPTEGMYKRAPRSRLVETAVPGVYSLDV